MTDLSRIRDEMVRAIGSTPAPRRRRGPVVAAALALLVGGLAGVVVLWSSTRDGSAANGENGVGVVPVESARTDGDGSALVLAFYGSDPDLSANDPCSVSYTGVVSFEGAIPSVGVEARSPEWSGGEFECTAEAHARNVSVNLPEPFDGQEVRDLASGKLIDLFDGSLVCAPTRPPTGYSLLAEYEATGPLHAWTSVFTTIDTSDSTLSHEFVLRSGDQALRESYIRWPIQPGVDRNGQMVEIRQKSTDPARRVAIVNAGSNLVFSAEYSGPADGALTPRQLADVIVNGCTNTNMQDR